MGLGGANQFSGLRIVNPSGIRRLHRRRQRSEEDRECVLRRRGHAGQSCGVDDCRHRGAGRQCVRRSRRPLDIGDLTGHPHDPATGAATGLAGRIGTDCNFEDIVDNGTIVCSLDGSSTAIRVIAPDGTQTNYSVPGLTSRRCLNGGVALSPDAGFAAVSIQCPTASSVIRLVLLDVASGHVVAVTGASNLSPDAMDVGRRLDRDRIRR